MKWEYRIMKFEAKKNFFFGTNNIDAKAMHTKLNQAGQQGWELVTAMDTTDTAGTIFIIYTFKRPAS
jgi:hypothetical protein